MTKGIRLMKELGYFLATDKQDDIVRRFIKYDDDGYITDTINYFYTKELGVQVFANDIKNKGGSRLDHDLVIAVLSNIYEVDFEYR